ncbi:hypothetical protein SISSUDRAFT_1131648 [Sistotremastrum suecicum HHB10207 ss-3]|uniref:RNase III domain-containing protein n=1 Tax=Sistotremastrum suecicum HHB10207 ss-3 TaxID=1314776 RepID=A0A165ZW89_9AGAM|nr:hypothetical protein SISSUDRAFT_1131648 [Sistotremastrum suecicum HHB10207 ss-3]
MPSLSQSQFIRLKREQKRTDESKQGNPGNCLETLLIKELADLPPDVFPDLPDLPPKLQKLLFNCHATENRSLDKIAGELSEEFVAAIVADCSKISGVPVSNKLLEYAGDLVVDYVVRRWCEHVAKTALDHASMASLLTRNSFMAHLAFHMGLLEHPFLSFEPSDALAVWIWKQTPESRSREPPKVIANLFEALMGAMWLRHGLTAVYDWFEPVLEALYRHAQNDAHATDQSQLPPYAQDDWKNGKDADSVCFMRDFAVERSVALQDNGAPLRTPFHTAGFMPFSKKQGLGAPFAHKLSCGEAFLKLALFAAFMRTRYYLYFHEDGEKVANYMTGLLRLVFSPAVLGAFAFELKLHDFFVKDSEKCVPNDWMLCQAMICACGYFEENNDHQLSQLEPFFEIVVLGANAILGWKDFHGDYSNMQLIFRTPRFSYGALHV